MHREAFLVALLVAGAYGTLQWPSTYTATGLIVLPYAEISEPFFVVVDGANQRSLTSTYDGMQGMLLLSVITTEKC